MKTQNTLVRNSFLVHILAVLCIFGMLFSSCSSSDSPTAEVLPPLINDAIDTKAVLFVGNSLTNNNGMAEMVRRMGFTTDRVLLYAQHAPGSTRLADHADSGELESTIATSEWDFVSIQAQSAELALDGIQVENNVFPNALSLVDKIRANHNASIPLFYMTWGYENGAEGLCDPFPPSCTFEGMNGVIKENYLTLMDLAEGQVSPCAELWTVLRERHPELDLYAFDGIHPSILGSYAVALSFYTMIFKADPTLVTYHRDELDTADEQLLREIVKEVVFDRLSEWQSR